MTGGRAAAPTGPTGRQNNNNTTVPPPPMGAGAGQCTRPTNKQTILAPPASSLQHGPRTTTQCILGSQRIGIVVEEITERRLADNNNWDIRTNNSGSWGHSKYRLRGARNKPRELWELK